MESYKLVYEKYCSSLRHTFHEKDVKVGMILFTIKYDIDSKNKKQQKKKEKEKQNEIKK